MSLQDSDNPEPYAPQHPMEANTAALDPNHTHFILVDDRTKYKFGGEINLRAKLEEYVSKSEIDLREAYDEYFLKHKTVDGKRLSFY